MRQTAIALDDASVAHISYHDYGAPELLKYIDSATLTPQTLVTEAGSKNDIVVDSTGGVHVVYWEFTDSSTYEIKYVQAGETPQTLVLYGQQPSLAIDSNDVLHLGYSFELDVTYLRLDGSSSPLTIRENDSTPPMVAISTSDAVHLGYGGKLMRHYDLSQTAEEDIAERGRGGSPPWIAVDGAGRTHVAYQDGSDYSVYYTLLAGSAEPILLHAELGNASGSVRVGVNAAGLPHVCYVEAGAGVLGNLYHIQGPLAVPLSPASIVKQ